MNPRNLIHKVFSFLEARTMIGGLEISDTALRFVASGSSFTTSVRLLPGVIAAGRVQDEIAFLKSLEELRTNILGRKAVGTARISVVIVLSSAHVYSQVFALPLLHGDDLQKAVDLNLKMAVPGGAESSYAGWQILSENASSGKVEILSAFLEKNIADDLTAILRKTNFSVLAIESRALALSRLVRQEISNADPRVPVLVVSADTEGLDVLVMRGGNLQFDYFHSWNDLKGDAKQITLDDFRAMIVKSVNQLLNFYNGHWKEPVGKVLVGATGMQDEIIAAIKANFSINAVPMAPATSPPLSAEWFTAFGAALRGRMPRQSDKEVSLLGVNAQEEYRREEAVHFLGFWRVLTPLALLSLLLIMGGAMVFLGHVSSSLESQSVLKLQPAQSKEIDALKVRVQAFNQEVGYIAAVNAASHPKAPVLAKILEITSRRGITVNRISIGAPGEKVTLSGFAHSEDDIVKLKNELVITPGIKDVTLPFTNIRKEGDNYIFSLTFTASSPIAL